MLRCLCVKNCLRWKAGDKPYLHTVYNKWYVDGYIISYSDFIEYFRTLSVDEQLACKKDD